VTNDDRKLIRNLCSKLDRQKEQGTEIILRLQALQSTFVRLIDSLIRAANSAVIETEPESPGLQSDHIDEKSTD
jgi:hypothetical protein